MKAVKIILVVLLSLILVASVGLNILLFNSSFGYLLFKKDISNLHTMTSLDYNYITDLLDNPKDVGYSYSYSIENESGLIEKYTYHIAFNSEAKFSFSYEYIDGDKNKVSKYLTDSYLYVQTENSKTKKALTDSELKELKVSVLEEISNYHYLAYSIINSSKTSSIDTGLNISFSPFYFLGIEVEVDDENTTDYEFNYDLDGYLRKISYTDKNDQEISIKLSEKSSKIKFPDFKNFILEK